MKPNIIPRPTPQIRLTHFHSLIIPKADDRRVPGGGTALAVLLVHCECVGVGRGIDDLDMPAAATAAP